MGGANKKRTQNALDYQGSLAQNHMNELWGETGDKNAFATNQYTTNALKQGGDYDRIMSGYQDFANTGGYSPDDLTALRSRASAPLRSIYASANREVDRNKALQGGYAPGYGAAKAKLSRDLGQNFADSELNSNAAIAEMVHAGKLQGLQGQNQIYSSTPGLASLYGSQALEAQGQRNQLGGMQNQLGLGIANQQNNIGGGGGILGGLKSGLGLLGQGLGLIPKLFPGGGKNNLPSTSRPQTPAQAPVLNKPPTPFSPVNSPGAGMQVSPEADAGYGNNVPGYDDYAAAQEAKNPTGNTGVTSITTENGENVPRQLTNSETGQPVIATPMPGAPGFFIGEDGTVYDENGNPLYNYGAPGY